MTTTVSSQNSFDQKKKSILDQINSTNENNPDSSPKGTLDVILLPLINLINSHPDMVTTSSCSGRVSVFLEGFKSATDIGGKGDGGKWLFITHDPVEIMKTDWWTIVKNHQEKVETEKEIEDADSGVRYVLFKFEAMILHVKCRDKPMASALYTSAMGCGFRESGIGSNDLVAIRISMRLDVPIGYLDSDNTRRRVVPLVSNEYVHHLERISLDLFEKNFRKIDQLYHNIESLSSISSINDSTKETKEERRERKRREGLELRAIKDQQRREQKEQVE